jgi:hypothetical protein
MAAQTEARRAGGATGLDSSLLVDFDDFNNGTKPAAAQSNLDRATPIESLPTTEGAEGVSVEDFYGYMPTHSYIFTPTRETGPAASINSRIKPIDEPGTDKPTSASAWIDKNRPVEQMTWAPGEPMLIANQLVFDGGWIDHEGLSCFNLYRAPVIILGDPASAEPWVKHVSKVYPKDAGHIINWLAHRVQRPWEKN